MIHNWKRLLLKVASELFERGSKASSVEPETQAQLDKLYGQIGQLKVERDFLVTKSARLGLPTEKLW